MSRSRGCWARGTAFKLGAGRPVASKQAVPAGEGSISERHQGGGGGSWG